MKIVCRLLLICVAAGFAAATHAEDTPSAMYSFADIYRMTVGGTAPQALPMEPQVRVATVQAAPAADVRFTIKPVPGPERWWLVLAGLAAAAWVAHRRLTRPY
ncbi:MAG TPA: hypothetical protein VFK84_05995 [Burkholderiales bacterium]|nr:hypothetical protein [Burkholderiales bacterium]